MARPGDALPQDVPTHMKLTLVLIVLAFQMDKTRIATCMLNNDLSQMNFGVGGRPEQGRRWSMIVSNPSTPAVPA